MTKGVKECPKLLKLGKPETEKNNQIIQCFVLNAKFCFFCNGIEKLIVLVKYLNRNSGLQSVNNMKHIPSSTTIPNRTTIILVLPLATRSECLCRHEIFTFGLVFEIKSNCYVVIDQQFFCTY